MTRWFKDRLDRGDDVLGIWLSAGSHVAAEVAAAVGFDWALLDLEHGLGSEADVLRQLQVLDQSATAAVVRAPRATSDVLGRVLDYGATAVMAPSVDTADQARAFVAALRYPPAGTRGLSGSSRAARWGLDFRDYFAQANERLTALVQIETAAGMANAEAIAAVDGVDVLFIGHSDLGLALGCPGQLDAPAIAAAEEAVLAACARHGKRAGMLLKAGVDAGPYRERGFSVLALGSDVGCLRAGLGGLLARARPTA